MAPRSAVRALWALAALGRLTPERARVLSAPLLLAGGGGFGGGSGGGGGLCPSLSDAQLAVVAEAAELLDGDPSYPPLGLPAAAAARCARALEAERAEGRRRAARASSFAADADALGRAAAAAAFGGRGGCRGGGGWRRLERDLAAWAKAPPPADGDAPPGPPVLLLLADEEGEAGTSALDHRAGGGILPPPPPGRRRAGGGAPFALGGLALRARLARREAFPLPEDASVACVLVLSRRALRAAGRTPDEAALLSLALPLSLSP